MLSAICYSQQHALAGYPPPTLSVSSNVNVPDGGVDASILGTEAVTDVFTLLAPATRYQLKTGRAAAPWQKQWVHGELFGHENSATADNLGVAVRRCLNEGGRFVLVCFGIDPTDEQLRQSSENFTEFFRGCGYPNIAFNVLAQTQLLGLFNEFPGLCLRLSGRDSAAFRCRATWASADDMRSSLHTSAEQQGLIDEIRAHIRAGDFPHIRLIGSQALVKLIWLSKQRQFLIWHL